MVPIDVSRLQVSGVVLAGGLARLVAASHLAYIVFMLVGGFAARRWPRLTKWHLGALGAGAAVNLAGADCPLTVWEKRCLHRAGHVPYETGFVSHYLVEPVYPRGIDGRVRFVILVALAVPNLVSYWRLSRIISDDTDIECEPSSEGFGPSPIGGQQRLGTADDRSRDDEGIGQLH